MSAAQDPQAFGVGRLFWLTSEAIVGADIDSARIVLWNPSAERVLGYSASEALGMALHALVPTDARPAHLAGIERFKTGRGGSLVGGDPVDVLAVCKDGSTKDVSLSLTDLSQESGRRIVLAILRDVSAQRAAERELARANESMRLFMAAASHDLRTPLSTVIGFSRLLLERAHSLGEEMRIEAIEAILRGGEAAARLVEDLLMLSKLEAGSVLPQQQTVRVRTIVDSAERSVGSGASIRVPADLEAVVDPDHLERILVNFLSNAKTHGRPPIEVTATVDPTSVAVRVTDAGPGVPDAFREQLFDAFARAEPHRPEGTGLGLSIVKGLAEANGGTAFYGEDGGGSTFGVVLRRAQEVAPLGEGA